MNLKTSTIQLAALSAISLTLGLSLLACGDSSSSDNEQTVGGFPSVETFEDLVHCTKSHYGEISHVAETDSLYECTSEGWVAIDSSEVEDLLSSSSGEESGKSSAADDVSSSSVQVSAEDTSKVDVVKVDSTTLTGFAQKGPFLSGAAVTVYGLDSAFARTKTKFSGKVAGDSGAYSVAGIVHSSQYAEVEVLGFYKNAVTGKNTSGTKTKLSALVDMSAVEKGENKSLVKANVNLFTELERARALKLIKNEKYNVPAAKIRASREIVNVFGKNFDVSAIDTAKVGSATGMSLADTGVVGRALYAAGVMMTTGLSLSKSANLIAEVAEDIAENGAWNSDTTRAQVADNLCYQDSVDGFAAVRKNIKEMKINASAPDFEANLQYFWYNELGLGKCTDSLETAETVRKVTNKLSDNYRSGFACTSKRWHKVTALDTELGMCTSKMEGVYKESLQKTGKKYYTCEKGTWKEISRTVYELRSCTESIAKTDSAFRKVGEEYFRCANNQWDDIDSAQYELKFCTDAIATSKDAYRNVGGEYFLCANNQWNDIDSAHYVLKFCSETIATSKDAYRNVGDGYYLCTGSEWEKISELDFELKACSDTTSKVYRNIGKEYFYCDGSKWSAIDSARYVLKTCTAEIAKTEDAFQKVGDKYFKCADGKWNESNATEFELKFCTAAIAKTDDAFKKVDSKYFVCSNGSWKDTTAIAYELKFCTDEKNDNYAKVGEEYYHCQDKAWTEISAVDYSLKLCTEARKNESAVLDEVNYVCDWNGESGSWRLANDLEKEIGVCGSAIIPANTFKQTAEGKYYVCLATGWSETDKISYSLETVCNAAIDSSKKKLDTKYYACLNGEWKTINVATYEFGYCTNNLNGTYKKSSDDGYWRCDVSKNNWVSVTNAEFVTKTVCDESRDSTFKSGYACVNVGGTYYWREATEAEWTTQDFCDLYMNTKIVNGYVCDYTSNGYFTGWRKAWDSESVTGFVCGRKSINDGGSVIKNTETIVRSGYVCTESSGVTCTSPERDGKCWRKATDGERATGYVCNGTYSNKIMNGYACHSGIGWEPVNDGEKATGYVCSYNKHDDISNGYICAQVDLNDYQWREVTSSEESVGEACDYNRNKLVRYKNENKYYRCFTNTHVWGEYGYSTLTDNRRTENGEYPVYRIITVLTRDKKSEVTMMVDNLNYHGSGTGSANTAWWCYNWNSKSVSDPACSQYGTLYHWTAVVNVDAKYLNESKPLSGTVQGVCPSGWHVPSNTELSSVDNQFAIIPEMSVGFYDYEKKVFRETAIYWSSNQSNATQAYGRYASGNTVVTDKHDGAYLRCFKD